jgi:hypothetical protein
MFLNMISNSNRRILPARRIFPHDGDEDFHRKELSFFGTERFSKGMRWYSSHFSRCDAVSRAAQVVSIDASPGMIHSPVAPSQLRSSYAQSALGDLRFVVLFRNPVERLASWHSFLVRILPNVDTNGRPLRASDRFIDMPRNVNASKGESDCNGFWKKSQKQPASAAAAAGAAESGDEVSWTLRCGHRFSCLGPDAWAQGLLSGDPDRGARYFEADARGLESWLSVFQRSQFFVAAFEELQPDDGATLTRHTFGWLGIRYVGNQRKHRSSRESHPQQQGGPSQLKGSVMNAGTGDSSRRTEVFSNRVRRGLELASVSGLLRLRALLKRQRLGTEATGHFVESWLSSALASNKTLI